MQNEKVMIYDDSCPMCRLYTHWFVAAGLLKSENRVGFANALPELTAHIDLDRGRHEIPLYDRATGQTIYGLKAMTHLLACRWDWLSMIFNTRLFWLVFQPIYNLITYNRRVIAGCKHCSGFDCAPDLNRFYRSIYLGLSGCLVLLLMMLLLQNPSTFSTIGLGLLGGHAIYGLIAGSIRRITSGSLAGWNFAGNHMTILVIISLTIFVGWMIGPNASDFWGWTMIATASLLGISEMKRREVSLL